MLESLYRTPDRPGDGGQSNTWTRRWNAAHDQWGYGGLDVPTPYLDDVDIEGPREVSEDECSWDARRLEGGVEAGMDTTGYDVGS